MRSERGECSLGMSLGGTFGSGFLFELGPARSWPAQGPDCCVHCLVGTWLWYGLRQWLVFVFLPGVEALGSRQRFGGAGKGHRLRRGAL